MTEILMNERKVIIPNWNTVRTIYDLRMLLWRLPDEARIDSLNVKEGKFLAELYLPAENAHEACSQ